VNCKLVLVELRESLPAGMEIAALAATLQGLDLLVFTGGIGQHSSRVRAAVVEGLAWMGLRLDPLANAEAAQAISSQDSAVQILMLETDEEAMIALHMRTLLGASSMREGKRD
jgi:acetate kinase